mmetsp:Transcript_1386/g.2769  ORF Transcript_1386/g.2769 Transcript_1386/m.2769 type:complete len:449 (+) Transcript_1386:80-1426(+)
MSRWPQHLTINAALTHNNTKYQNNSDDTMNPPMDPPPFEDLPIQMCTTINVQINNYRGAREVYVPWPAVRTVQSWLSELFNYGQPDQPQGNSDENEEEDEDMMETSDDSDSLSEFDDSSFDDSDDEEGGETSENGQHPSQPQDARPTTRPTNNRIAYWIPDPQRDLIMKNKRGHVVTYVHRAIVLHKSDLYWVETNERVAIKRMSWEHIHASKGRMQEDFVKEIAALQYLSKFINGNNEQSHVMSANTIMANQSEVFIVMPYCANGDILVQVSESTLLNPYQGTPCLTEAAAKYWFRQMLNGLRTLQSARLCHRDLSPENFILLDNTTLMIDFGMCLRIPYSEDGTRHLISRRTACGKVPYMSPEVATHQPFDGHAVDIYSTGTVLLFMLTGLRLTGPITQDRMFDSMEPSKYGLSVEAMDLLRKMFRLNPVDRLTLDEIWAHQFLQT